MEHGTIRIGATCFNDMHSEFVYADTHIYTHIYTYVHSHVPIQHHPHSASTEVGEQEFPVTQHFDLPPSSL
jgi:hypothetical protein